MVLQVLVLFWIFCTWIEGGGRANFWFVFTWTASFWKAMCNKLCLYMNGIWSSVSSLGNGFSELKLVCLKKARRRWKLVLRFQLTPRRNSSEDFFSSHFAIKPVFWCWFLPSSADSLCTALILWCLSFLEWYRSKRKLYLRAWKSAVNKQFWKFNKW